MFEDDFEILEDDEQNVSPSSSDRYPNRENKEDANKRKEAIDKNKISPNNPSGNKNFSDKKQQDISNNNQKENKQSNSKLSTSSTVGDKENQFKKAGNVDNMTKGLNSDDPNEQKQALKNMGKDAIKPIVRKGVQAATGGAVGTDPVTGKIIDKAVDKVADSEAVEQVVDKVVGTVKKYKEIKRIVLITKTLVSIIGTLLPVILILVIISYLFMPVFGLDDWDGDVNYYEKKYYDELDRVASLYENVCGQDMNKDIITTTIFYDQMFYNSGFDINYDEYDEDDISIDGSALPKINFYGKDWDITILAQKLYPSFNFVSSNVGDKKTEEEITEFCGSDYNAYKDYIVDYMKANYQNMKAGTDYNKIAEEILAMNGQFIIDSYYSNTIDYQDITVLDEDGNVIGTYGLETYVASLLTSQADLNSDSEALKALAIAIRSDVLTTTNNGKQSVKVGKDIQYFQESTNEKAINIVKETEGLILKHNDEVYSGTIDYNLAYQMADNGSSYEKILHTIYPDEVEIGEMGALIKGATYTSTSIPPVNADAIKQRAKSGTDRFYNSSMGLVSQCPWYAKSRAAEILYYSNIPEDIKNIAIKSISHTSGNGGDVVSRADESIFIKSYDYSQPHPGSIISWTSSAADGPECHNYGHVAIIEQVNEDGTVVISDGWNNGGVHASNTWSNIAYRLRSNVPISSLASYTSNGCRYTFAGYVYLLG